MADLKIKSSKFMVNVNFNTEPREQVFIKCVDNNNCLIMSNDGVRILDKNGIWTEEIGFRELRIAFGGIKT